LIYTPTNGCYTLWKVQVKVTKESAIITPELSVPEHPSSCPAVGINKMWMIDLGSPLGKRRLLHPRVTANLNPLQVGIGG
jgi:hypothetical protein